MSLCGTNVLGMFWMIWARDSNCNFSTPTCLTVLMTTSLFKTRRKISNSSELSPQKSITSAESRISCTIHNLP